MEKGKKPRELKKGEWYCHCGKLMSLRRRYYYMITYDGGGWWGGSYCSKECAEKIKNENPTGSFAGCYVAKIDKKNKKNTIMKWR